MTSSSQQMAENHKISISYQDEQSMWSGVEKELQANLPLSSFAWRRKSGKVTMISKIETVFLPHDDKSLQFPPLPHNWYRKPLVYLYIVNCEDDDVYKNTVKNKLKNWTTSMTEKQNEWLIVYVSIGQSTLMNKLKPFMGKSIYEKIRSDFNTKKDRCCQIRLMDETSKNSGLWEDFIAKLKEAILFSFEQLILNYEEEIRKIDAKRMLPGWNYCNFFVIKEGLAFTYERAGLLDEALMQYDELDALFMAHLYSTVQTNMKVLDPEDKDISALNTLDTSKKPYRELIYQNSITEFDFCQYLFARQAKLLFDLNQPLKVLTRAMYYIQSLSKILDTHKDDIPRLFKESFIFSACYDVVQACLSHLPATDVAFADLYIYSTSMLEVIAQKLGLLSAEKELKFELPNPNAALPAPDGKIATSKGDVKVADEFPADLSLSQSNTELLESLDFKLNPALEGAFRSPDAFDALYLKLITSVLELFKNSNRVRNIAWLNGKIASLHFRRNRFAEAEDIFRELYNLYFEEGWYEITASIKVKAAFCQEKLAAWPDYVLSCVELLSLYSFISEGQRRFYLSELCRTATKHLDAEVTVEMAPLFESFVQIVGAEREFHVGEALTLEVIIHSPLDEKVVLDRVFVEAIDLDGESPDAIVDEEPSAPSAMTSISIRESTTELSDDFQIPNQQNGSQQQNDIKKFDRENMQRFILEKEKVELSPGQNNISLSTMPGRNGVYLLSSLNCQIGNLIFCHALPTTDDKLVINVIDSVQSVKLDILSSDCMIVGEVQYVYMVLESGNDHILSAEMFIFSPTNLEILNDEDNVCHKITSTIDGKEQDPMVIVFLENRLVINDLGPNLRLELVIPVIASDNTPGSHEITAEFEYTKATEEIFLITQGATFDFTLPFVGKNLVTPFQSTYDQFWVQSILNPSAEFEIISQNIEVPQGFLLSESFNQTLNRMTTFPNDLISFAFFLTRDSSAKPSENPSAQLKIEFKFVQDASRRRNEEEIFSFDWQIPLPVVDKVQFKIGMKFPEYGFLGSTILFEVDIVSNSKENVRRFAIETDDRLWIIVGRKKGLFKLEGKEHRISFQAIPLCNGFLPIPRINLLDTSPMDIDNSCSKQIWIFPPKEYSNCCQTFRSD